MSGDAATNGNSTSTIQIPVTIANLKTGVQRETYLNAASFGLTTTNVAIGTGVTTVGTYTVQAQEALSAIS